MDVREYVDENGQSPFGDWFDSLNGAAAAKITISIVRLGQGNFSNVKGVGSGIFECKIDFGPGYRIYFGKDGDAFIILLGGGTKKKQQSDIEVARRFWKAYKARRKVHL